MKNKFKNSLECFTYFLNDSEIELNERNIGNLLKCCIKSSKENHFCNLFFYLINSFIQTDFKIKKIIVIIENLISTSQSFSGLVFIIMLVTSFFVLVVQ